MIRFRPLRYLLARPFSQATSIKSFDDQIAIIKKYSGYNEEAIRHYFERDDKLTLMNLAQVESSCNLVKSLRIQTSTAAEFLELVRAHPITIENRAVVLKEAGVNPELITSRTILKYLTVVKTKVKTLKKKGYINPKSSILNSLLEVVHLDPSEVSEVPEDDVTLIAIKELVVTAYLKKMLEFPEGFKLKDVAVFRLNHKSLVNTKESLKIALDEIGFTKEKVRNNPYILYAHPANTRAILANVPEICGSPMSRILRTHPKILSSTCESILESMNHFRRFGITDTSILKSPEIFTLKSSTILERLETLKKIQYLKLRMNHPRFLKTVFYFNKVLKRIKLVEENKLAYASINIIATTEKKFEKFYEEGIEKPRGTDIIQYLKTELGLPKSSLRDRLNRHPYWPYLPLVDIGNTLKLLRGYGYTDDDISCNIYILFYPTVKVAKELDAIRSNKQENLGSYKPGFNYEIQLALYELERVFNFTGEAVWSEQVSASDVAKD